LSIAGWQDDDEESREVGRIIPYDGERNVGSEQTVFPPLIISEEDSEESEEEDDSVSESGDITIFPPLVMIDDEEVVDAIERDDEGKATIFPPLVMKNGKKVKDDVKRDDKGSGDKTIFPPLVMNNGNKIEDDKEYEEDISYHIQRQQLVAIRCIKPKLAITLFLLMFSLECMKM
jgi:hypothetical protein